MRKAFNRLFVFAVTACILISGNGVVLSIHTCFSKSIKDVSLFNDKSCCSSESGGCGSEKNENDQSLNAKCCSIEFAYHKISSSFLPQKSLELPVLTFFSSTLETLVFSVPVNVPLEHFIPPLRPTSVPVTFRQLLI